MKTTSPALWSILLLALLVLGGCASLPDNAPRTESMHFTDTGDTEVVNQNLSHIGAEECGKCWSQVDVFDTQ